MIMPPLSLSMLSLYYTMMLSSDAVGQNGAGQCEDGSEQSSLLQLEQARLNLSFDTMRAHFGEERDGECVLRYDTEVIIENQYQDEGFMLQRYFDCTNTKVFGEPCTSNSGISFTTDPNRIANAAALWKFTNSDGSHPGDQPFKYGDHILIINQYESLGVWDYGCQLVRYSGLGLTDCKTQSGWDQARIDNHAAVWIIF